MKRLNQLLTTAAVALLAVSGANAAPMLVSGWDMSFFLGEGTLSTDGNSQTSFGANYSSFDTSGTAGLGGGSEVYGSMTIPFAPTVTPADALVPLTGSLGIALDNSLNLPTKYPPLTNPFDSFNELFSDGQNNVNALSLFAQQAVSGLVFSADLPGTGMGTNWDIFVTARSDSGGQLQIAFSPDATFDANELTEHRASLSRGPTPYSRSMRSSG